jgi:GT2 family glycosyltransferase
VSVLCPAELGPAPLTLEGSRALADSYLVYQRLRRQSFDIIYFHDRGAPGYFSLLARRQGLVFPSTRLCLLAEGPTLWRIEHEGDFLDHLDQLECDALERRCVELADAVVGDEDVLRWMSERDWPRPLLKNTVTTVLDRLPLVSVCLVHHDRPEQLRQALASLEAQDYPHFEIVLVDDGSTTVAARAFLAGLEPLFLSRGWPLVRQANRYLGAARNAAARHARGEYLLFMDDDNVARPHELSTFVRVAERTGADILTAFADLFEGDGPPGEDDRPLRRRLFAGVDSLVGVARNCYGDANALVRRSAFESLGGFTEEQGVTHEDWEFFARATLRGCHLEVVPEPLFWYRLSAGGMHRSTPAAQNYARSLRPFLEEVPASHRELLRLTQGLALSNQRLRQQLGLDGRADKPLRYRIADILHAAWRRVPLVRQFGPLWRRLVGGSRR